MAKAPFWGRSGLLGKAHLRGGIRRVLGLVMGILLLVPCERAGADTIVYRQGGNNAFVTNYSGATDTYLPAHSPDLNYGGALSMSFAPSDDRVGLLRFNLTSFAGKYVRITGISLSLRISSIVSPPGEGDFSLYAVSPANAGWVAGTGDSNGSTQVGTSTWNRRLHDTTSWAGSAGLGTAGTDYNTTLLATHHWTATGDFVMNFTGTPAQLKALIDQWSGPQPSNAGLLLRNVTTAGATGTASVLAAQSTLSGSRPGLTITYTSGPAIIVEQPAGTELLNGASTQNFGASGSKTFTLRNDGTASLTNIVASVTGGNSGDFAVGSPGATTLAPGASTTFAVTFTPAGASTRSTTLRITSNDTSASPFTVPLTGTGWTTLQAWRHQYFETILNTGNAADGADPDGDGLNNFLEFALGRDPEVFDTQVPLSLQIDSGNVVTLSFMRARPPTEVTYTVRASPDLSAWEDYAINPGTVGESAILNDNVSAAPLRFFRLNVQAP
jgi:hypothetical protein